MDGHKPEELAENHKRIWLAPRCEVDERTWCEDDNGCCDECSEEWVEYVRADIAKAEIERLRAALTEIHDFPYVGTQASTRIQQIARQALEQKSDDKFFAPRSKSSTTQT